MRKRIFVEKKLPFAIEAKTLEQQIFLLCMVKTPVRIINIYDLIIPNAKVLSIREKAVFADSLTDVFNPLIELKKHCWFASEYLPNQFDPRAKSAAECLKLINLQHEPYVTTGKLYLLSKKITSEQLTKIKRWLINKAEMQEKNLSVFGQSQKHQKQQALFLNNFSG